MSHKIGHAQKGCGWSEVTRLSSVITQSCTIINYKQITFHELFFMNKNGRIILIVYFYIICLTSKMII